MIKQKITNIETLRGLAIILVVMGHVIGSTPNGGMKIDFPSPWRYLYLWIDYIQMPLFTAIAGWVYALKPVQKEYLKYFILKKVYRLLIPMAVVGTLYFLIQYIIPGTNNKGTFTEIWKIYIFPYTIYWYLPSLFLMFIFIFYVDIKHLADRIEGWILIILVSLIGLSLEKTIIPYSLPNIFSFKGALAQLPFFIVGVGVNRFSKQIFSSELCKIYFIFATIGILLLQVEWIYPIKENMIYKLIQPILVISLLILLLHQKKSFRFLTWIGGYAYSIYLFHGFGTAGGRIILTRLGIQSEILIFLFASIISLFTPIILEKVSEKWSITNFLFLGK